MVYKVIKFDEIFKGVRRDRKKVNWSIGFFRFLVFRGREGEEILVIVNWKVISEVGEKLRE